ncbi:MAG: hypothetical protein SOT68_01750 [Oscillospiraceae bacterium]|nr:hypothetical protein [Oscillospiraceae bacterium]MDD7277997.1 hypothetical protein [Oscillospiraceae bacterium]MDY2862902.1 hypothetical protein [Oscillospiraceae bacterium]
MKFKSKAGYYLSIISIYIISAAMLAVGGAVVTVNCHNAVSSDKMTLFDINVEDGDIIVTVMDKNYHL